MQAYSTLKADGMTFQQKLWKGTRTVIWAVKPVLLYLFLPPVLMSVGMVLFGGRSAGKVIADSGNFYHALGIAATILLLEKKSRKKGSSLCEESGLELKKPDIRRAGLLMAAGLGFSVFFSAVITVLPFSESLLSSYHGSSAMIESGTDRLLAVICTVFMAPVAEEIVFRGYMLGRLLSWFTKEQSIFLSAALFALCHVSLLWIVYACLMGILLAWVSIREDDTMYSIILHIGFNLSVIPVGLINGNPGWKNIFFGNSFRIALIGGAALIGALAALKRYMEEIKND